MSWRKLKGKTISKVKLNPFNGGTGQAYNPEITFTDGTLLRFVVQETETGEYGVGLIVEVKNG